MLYWIKDNKQIVLSFIIFLFCYFILVGYSLGPQSALDTYWHLKMGSDLLENDLSPWFDNYSFTYNGEIIKSVPVLFQVSLAFFVSIFGEISGFIFYKLVYVTFLMLAIYRLFKIIKVPWFITFLILPFIVYFIQIRLILRPELISNILVIICLSLYFKTREKFDAKGLLLICALILFWVNYHTPVLGYIIIFGLFLDRGIYKFGSSEAHYSWYQLGLWGLVIVLIGFINPKFEHVLLLVLSLSNEWKQYLSEYLPSHVIYSKNIMVHILWVVSIYLVIWSIIKKQYGLAFVVAFLTFNSWFMLRLIPVVGLINFSILAYFLSQVDFKKLNSNISAPFRYVMIFAYISLFFFVVNQTTDKTYSKLLSLSNFPRHVSGIEEIMEKRFPVQVTDYLKSFHNGGNVLNSFNIGGYLIYALPHDFKIYIDGRTNILYPIEFYKHYLKVISDIDELEKDLQNHEIQYAIFRNSIAAHRYFSQTDSLVVNFSDEGYILYSRNTKIAFPVSSKLIKFPMCWDDRFTEQVHIEHALSEKLFHDKNYTVKSILNLLKDYLDNSNRIEFIDDLNPDQFKIDSVKRLTAYLLFKSVNYTKSYNFFKSIVVKNDRDALMMAFSLVMNGNHREAKAVVDFYLTKKFTSKVDAIPNFDKIILITILTTIKHDNDSSVYTTSDVEKIVKELNVDQDLNNKPMLMNLAYDEICSPVFKSF